MTIATAKCDRTGNDLNIAEGFLVAAPSTGEWQFVARQAPEEFREYCIPFAELLGSPHSFVDWMAHLYEKSWFKPEKFFQFFHRFRQENNLYNG